MPCAPTPPAIVNRADVIYPEMARQQHAEGTTFVTVELTADGKPAKVAVKHSAGNGMLDAEALKTAKASTYKAATEDCKPVAAAYILVVDFKS